MHLYPKNVTDIHIELTDKCQASCPMCARNYLGGKERPFVGKNEITLEKFKEWFTPEFLSQINNFYACGNYGDPIIAKDCLEIFKYVRENTNSSARLSIHTNGSARTTQWWAELAKVLEGPHDVTFGIDGYKESHVLYRRGTNWDKIIENATAFINAGGIAKIDTLVFEHNQHEIESFKKDMLNLGFSDINVKYTGRFYNMDKFPVYNANGKHEYDLKPANANPVQYVNIDEIGRNINVWKNIVDANQIEPKCISRREIYVDARGTVYPCCWIGGDLVEEPIEVKIQLHNLRNQFVYNSKLNFNGFTNLNLNIKSMDLILADDAWNFIDKKPWTCIKNCKK
jgi:MoaA/NifB/PqqE/SkfB family radical SAM enzyme